MNPEVLVINVINFDPLETILDGGPAPDYSNGIKSFLIGRMIVE